MNFKIRNFLLLFLLMLPFGNFPQLFRLGEDTGSMLILVGVIPLFVLWVLLEKKLYKPILGSNKFLISILFLGVILNFVSIIFGTVDYGEGMKILIQFSIPKLIFLYLIVIVAERINIPQSNRILLLFLYFVIASLFLSIPAYFINPMPEFVLYDGGTRFAGFHFELVNYSYVLLICFFIYSYFNKFSFFKFFFIAIFIYISGKSNAFYPFILVALMTYYFGLKNYYSFNKYLAFSIIILTPIIGLFLDYFSFLELFALRGATSFSLEGSQLFIRLYPWALSMQHFLDTFFILPVGLGMLEISPSISEVENLFGGTGITKTIAEYGFFSLVIVPFVMLYFVQIIKNLSFIENPNKRLCLTCMLLLSLTYICIQSGFFNFTAWAICIIVQTIALKYSCVKIERNL